MEQNMDSKIKRYNHLMTELDAAYHEVALKFNLSDSAMLILYTICNNGDWCLLSDITRLSGASKQTINSALRKLEAKDIVYLEPYNSRMKRVCLTDKGHAFVQDTVRRVIEVENQIFGSWTKAEWVTYLELTRRYLTMFREKARMFNAEPPADEVPSESCGPK